MHKKQKEVLTAMQQRFASLEQEMATGQALEDHTKRKELAQELNKLRPSVRLFEEYLALLAEQDQVNPVRHDKSESEEMRELAENEYQRLAELLSGKEEELTGLLLGRESGDDRDVYIEVRAGAGGSEAAIFAGDMLRMYSRYAEQQKWETELVNQSFNEQGGYRSAVLVCRGENVYGSLKFESGTHRVQRVPKTETQGRLHTSTCTIAIIPEATAEDDIEINKADLRIDTYRASGAGGQHVNKTDSAVRITHIPSGVVSECQEERSQHRNKEKALRLLNARLLLAQREQTRSEEEQLRRSLVGTADRAEKVRTYNFPQNRVTDHRIKLTLHNLTEIMEGDLDSLLEPLGKEERLRLSTAGNLPAPAP